MKFPSLQQLQIDVKQATSRFTFPIIYALIATSAALAATYKVDEAWYQYLTKVTYLGNFGTTLSLAFSLYADGKSFSVKKVAVVNFIIFLLLIFIYYTLNPNLYNADVIVLVVIGFACHLLVSFSAFTTTKENNGFWQINKGFFLRFATSSLYSAVLFIGLSVALLSIDTLFNVKWDYKIYLRLFIIIVGVFNTIFFLAGIKYPLKDLNEDDTYPKGLKVFTQYVLIPLATIYLCILLAYEVKIILEWRLPTSSVAILILGYAVFGILSILLIYPIRNLEGNKWINLYTKSFYLLMIPLLLLLAISIFKRVSDYGITESRYLLIALAFWLTFVTSYFLIRGKDQIRIIPISLFVVAVLITFGPWGIQYVARVSQQNRLAEFIGKKPEPKRNNEIRNLVSYLYDHFGVNALQPFIKTDIKSIKNHFLSKKIKQKYLQPQQINNVKDSVLNLLKVNPAYEFIDNNGILASENKSFKNIEEGIIDVSGALKIVEFDSNIRNRDKKNISFYVDRTQFSITIDSLENIILTPKNDRKIVFVVDTLLKDLLANKNLKPHKFEFLTFITTNSSMQINKTSNDFNFTCRFESISGGLDYLKKRKVMYHNGYLIIYPKK
jgi:hypothetical protein